MANDCPVVVLYGRNSEILAIKEKKALFYQCHLYGTCAMGLENVEYYFRT